MEMDDSPNSPIWKSMTDGQDWARKPLSWPETIDRRADPDARVQRRDDTASRLDPRDVLRTVQHSDVVVYGVNLDRVTRDSRRDRESRAAARHWFTTEPPFFRSQYLGRLVEDTGGSVFVAEDIGRLRAVFSQVISEFRSRYWSDRHFLYQWE